MNTKVVAGVAVAVILVVVLFALFMTRGKTETEAVSSSQEDNNSVVVSKDLKGIKSRIREIEKYRTREYYRSETNNGLTIAGTILEQMIDVAAAVFEQPLVHELTKKVLNKKEDAAIFAEYIELFGAELVQKIKKNPLLKCKTPLIEVCEGGDENGSHQLCSLQEDPNAEVKTSNCKAYRPQKENMENIARDMIDFFREIIADSTHQSKLYPPIKNVIIDNWKMYAAADGEMTDEQMNAMNKQISEFPEEKEFWRTIKTGGKRSTEPPSEDV